MLPNCPQAMHKYELCRIFNFMLRASIPPNLVSRLQLVQKLSPCDEVRHFPAKMLLREGKRNGIHSSINPCLHRDIHTHAHAHAHAHTHTHTHGCSYKPKKLPPKRCQNCGFCATRASDTRPLAACSIEACKACDCRKRCVIKRRSCSAFSLEFRLPAS